MSENRPKPVSGEDGLWADLRRLTAARGNEMWVKTMNGAQNTKSPSSTCENTDTELPSRQPLPTTALLPT